MTTYRNRKDVPVQETWNLADIYPNIEEWYAQYNLIDQKVSELEDFNGRISNAEELYQFLSLKEEITYEYSKLYVYAFLQHDLDTRVSTSQALLDKARHLGQKISSATSFFMPFLLSLDESTLTSYINEVKELTYFEDSLLESYRYKRHVLSKEQEEILSKMGDALGSPRQTFGMINNADIRFGDVTNDSGEKVTLTRGMYSKLIEDKNREKRKEAFQAYYKPYMHLQHTIASTLSSAIKNTKTTSEIRQYPSTLERALFSDNVPKEVYENLIQTTKAHIQPLHDYMDIRKKELGLQELHQYDLSIPLVKNQKLTISYDKAYETMLESLYPLGEEYVNTLKSFKEKRYIDVRETPGKRSGAYNLGLYGVHPFVLLNHQDDLSSLFTLTHEMGHAMHSYYSNQYQPQIKAGYSIFVAEVASTVNEVLLIRYLIDRAKTEEEKKYLVNHFIDQFKGTFFTQVMFAEFEQITHEKAQKQESLNAEVFSDVYGDLMKQYYGPSLVADEETKFGWARIPHFYRPFYVYKYATGFVSAIDIADRLIKKEEGAKEAYLQFLQSGSSDYPLELLKSTNVDLLKPDAITNAMSVFAELVKQLAK
ncbi:oligoendopeptidase F [Priestia aryabhattai]|uniref:oligoendopeptidase F n=1 Tax=Bacillaceae TaxID=186817 RepID=UPI000BA13C96|nr:MULTISPECIES: oligoendopeptidase F [Bacillaceae]MDT2046999.1 oligoendopeptidase F [Priestia flexa]OZT14414.1 oligoendopeptidase F [Priestia aryabhattai]TDB54777.1 oligoendopeptidase F [Bacillus sp. CBEL-1]